MVLSQISKSMAELNLKVKVLNFESQLQDLCKNLIESTKSQLIKEIEGYLSNAEKYTQFKEYS